MQTALDLFNSFGQMGQLSILILGCVVISGGAMVRSVLGE